MKDNPSAKDLETVNLAKMFDRLAAKEQPEMNVLVSSLMFFFKAILRREGIDVSPLDEALIKMGMIETEGLN